MTELIIYCVGMILTMACVNWADENLLEDDNQSSTPQAIGMAILWPGTWIIFLVGMVYAMVCPSSEEDI